MHATPSYFSHNDTYDWIVNDILPRQTLLLFIPLQVQYTDRCVYAIIFGLRN